VNRFPPDKLGDTLTLETYVIGKPDSFCYWVEHKTIDLGKMRINNAGDYGVYFNAEAKKYCIKDGRSIKEVDDSTARTRFSEIKTQLIDLIGYAKVNEIDNILKVPVYRHFKEKIISLYFPDKYLAIFFEDHIDHFLKKLGLFTENVVGLDPIRKKQALLDFKNADPVMKSWLPNEYMDFLYEMFPPSSSELTGVWLEKTKRIGRKDREEGDFAVGKALWSPQRDKRGADIYRSMRLIKRGDTVLHLVDDKAIVGISQVEEEHDSSFKCLPGTEWDDGTGNKPGYVVRLSNYISFEKPIGRELILNERYKSQLLSILDSEGRVFYNKDLNLRQGAYITSIPDQLLDIINDEFKKTNNKSLPYIATKGYPSKEQILRAIQELRRDRISKQEFLDKVEEIIAKEKSELKNDWREKTWENVKRWANKLVEQEG
jgi:hypothetical protein